jgi:predicted transcriptional regulator
VPPVGIADRGELILDNDKFSYKNWNSAQLAGKVRVVQHIAGRTSAKEKMQPDRSDQGRKIPARPLPDHHHCEHRRRHSGLRDVRTLSLESNKKLYPWSQFIVDSNGVTRKAWQLEEESSAIVVLDKEGRVQWAKDGALTQEEVQQVVALLHKLLAQ